MIIKISKQQRDLLIEVVQNNNELMQLFNRISEYNSKFYVDISNEEAELIRDLCCERLDFLGFDENYELTLEGYMLEELIDLFYIDEDMANDNPVI